MNEEEKGEVVLESQGASLKKNGSLRLRRKSRQLTESLAYYKETSPSLLNAIYKLQKDLDDSGPPIEDTIEDTIEATSSSSWDLDSCGLSDVDNGLADLKKELENISLPKATSNMGGVKKTDQRRGGLTRGGYSFIKRQSVRNIVKGLDDIDMSMDDILEEPSKQSSSKMWDSGFSAATDERSNDGLRELQAELENVSLPKEKSMEDESMKGIAEEPSTQLSSKMWESDSSTVSDDGLEDLKDLTAELENASLPQKNSIKNNINKVTPAASESKSMDDNKGNADLVSPSPPPRRNSLQRGLSFIKQNSFFNLMNNLEDTFQHSMDDTAEDKSHSSEAEMDPDPDSDLADLERELNNASETKENEPKSQDSSTPHMSRKLSFIRRGSIRNSFRNLEDGLNNFVADMSDSSKHSLSESRDPDPVDGLEVLKRELESVPSSLEFKTDSNGDGIGGEIPNKLVEPSLPTKSNRINNVTTVTSEHKNQLENTSVATKSIKAFNLKAQQNNLNQSKRDNEKVSRGAAMEVPKRQPQQKDILQERNMALKNQVRAERNKSKKLQEKLNKMKEFSLNETDINYKKFFTAIPYESYGKRSWILRLFGGIFLAILLSKCSPVMTSVSSPSNRTTSTTFGGVKVLPSKTNISDHKYVKQALMEAKVIYAETQDFEKSLMEDQLVLDSLTKILRSAK